MKALLRLTALVGAAIGLLLVAACGGSEPEPRPVEGRVITLELWSGARPGVTGPAPMSDPVDGRPIQVYRQLVPGDTADRMQVLTVTQDGAALGRVTDRLMTTPPAERQFAGDAVFPLGLWRQGERRDFDSVEYTPFGPAARLITIHILDLAFSHQGVPGSLRFRLETRDAAGRLIACETSVYSPGKGLVEHLASTLWSGGAVC